MLLDGLFEFIMTYLFLHESLLFHANDPIHDIRYKQISKHGTTQPMHGLFYFRTTTYIYSLPTSHEKPSCRTLTQTIDNLDKVLKITSSSW